MPTPQEIAALMKLLGQPTPDVPAPARTDAEDTGGAYFERAEAWPDRVSTPPSESGFTRGDINLPRDPTPLDSNRLPEVSTRRFGQNASGQLPSRTVNPLDTNRLPEGGRLPGDANSGRVALARMFGVDQPPPDPRESAAVLAGGAMRANDPQALARNRNTEAHDLEDRIANESSALAMPPMEGFVPGEPGRRYLTRGVSPANLVADKFRLGQIRTEAAADPFTGDAETARVGGITHALDDAALTQRPEIGDAADTVAKRNAFATYMKERGLKMGDYEAAGSPAAQAAAMVPITANASDTAEGIKDKALRREQELKMSPQLVPGQMPDDSGGLGGFTLPPNYKPLNAADSNAIESMAKAAPMVGDLERMLDPNANQIPNKIAQTAKWGMYNLGVSPNLFGDAKAQARLQLSSLIKIVGSSPYMTGSRNYRYLQDVQKHLTDPSATDQFLLSQIAELKRRWPEMQRAIIQTHIQPGTALNFGGDDPWAAPPSPDEMSGAPMSMDQLAGRADALTRRRR